MSKHTLYFNNIEEANQYFPDGVPSNVIAIVGDGSQVLVSSDNNNTTNQQYYSADLTNDEIVNEMVQTSYNEGHSNGYSEGYDGGYSYGYVAGQTNGFYRDIYTVAMSEDDVIAYTSPIGDHADVYVSTIYDNFTYVDNGASSYITWDDIPTYFIPYDSTEQAYMSPKVYLWPLGGTTIDGKDASGWFGEFLDDNGDFIEDFYGEVHPVLHNVFWNRNDGTVPNSIFAAGGNNGQDKLYYENYVGDCMEEPEEITENGIYANNGQAYFDVNVEGSSDITDNDFLGQIVNNTITAGYSSFVISDNTPDSSVLTDAFQAASNGLGVVYKASGDTLSTLPLYNPYDEETGSQTEIVYNDGSNVNSYYDWMATAPISLQVGDMLGFVVGSGSNVLWIAPFDGSEPFVCETVGNYTVLMSSYTDDESGDTVWGLHIVPSTQLSGDYSNITNLNAMTMPINNGN